MNLYSGITTKLTHKKLRNLFNKFTGKSTYLQNSLQQVAIFNETLVWKKITFFKRSISIIL